MKKLFDINGKEITNECTLKDSLNNKYMAIKRGGEWCIAPITNHVNNMHLDDLNIDIIKVNELKIINKEEYLESLAEEYDIEIETVIWLASTLEDSEDFESDLLDILEDIKQDLEGKQNEI